MRITLDSNAKYSQPVASQCTCSICTYSYQKTDLLRTPGLRIYTRWDRFNSVVFKTFWWYTTCIMIAFEWKKKLREELFQSVLHSESKRSPKTLQSVYLNWKSNYWSLSKCRLLKATSIKWGCWNKQTDRREMKINAAVILIRCEVLLWGTHTSVHYSKPLWRFCRTPVGCGEIFSCLIWTQWRWPETFR